MHRAARFDGGFPQQSEVQLAIGIIDEAGGAVVAALDDVPRDSGQAKTSTTGHGDLLWPRSTRRSIVALTGVVVCPRFRPKPWSVPGFGENRGLSPVSQETVVCPRFI